MANMLLRFLLDCGELKFLRRKYQPIRVSALGQKQTCAVAKRHVRFTPESGHVQCTRVCPLCANSGHVMGDEPASALRPIWLLGKRSGARQNNLYFGELTRLCFDLY